MYKEITHKYIAFVFKQFMLTFLRTKLSNYVNVKFEFFIWGNPSINSLMN